MFEAVSTTAAAAPLSLNAGSRVAIIGGGFSGVMQAINLLRLEGPRAVLIERRPDQLGRGVAYSAAHVSHLLNVRAGNMSALPDDAGHFMRWLQARGSGDANTFVPRQVYGEYLQDMLDALPSDGRFETVIGEAVDVQTQADGERVIMRDGRIIDADAVVLAPGNLPPHDPPGFDHATLGPDLYAPDPWHGSIGEGLGAGDRVLLLGTGLTAIDAALLLDSCGFTGEIVALSRRGLVPHAHHDRPRDPQDLLERPPAALSDLVRFMRRRAERRGWRDAVDDLRPVTQYAWAAAPIAERARFLRHLRPYWDVHRHRLAPDVAARIADMQAAGRLRFIAGKTIAAVPEDGGLCVTWRARGREAITSESFRRVVNCTGPQGDLVRSDEPLLRTLRDRGRIRPDPLRLGLDVDAQSRVLDASGQPQERLRAIGPMTRGGLWEVVAVPDLRNQTWNLARRLANQHWIGGEGL